MRVPRGICSLLLGMALAASVLAGRAERALAQARFIDDKLEDLASGGAAIVDEEGDVTIGPPGVGKPPRVSANVQVNDPQAAFPTGLVGRSETSNVASADGFFMVAGWNDADGFCFLLNLCAPAHRQPGLSGFGFSNDGGETWTDGGAPPLFGNNVFTFGDPWLDRGGLDGQTFYYSNLAAANLGSGAGGLSVHRGHFDGAGNFAWEDGRFIQPLIATDFLDKEALGASKGGSGLVIVSYTNFLDLSHPSRGICPATSPSGFGQIEIRRSVDGGATYSGPIVVGPDLTDTAADPNCNVGTSQQSSSPAFGPNGEVYVVWERGPRFTGTGITPQAEIVVATSLDGGMNWSAPVKVADVNHMRGAPPVAYNRNRINNHPRIEVAQGGTFQGRIYVVFSSLVSPVSGVPVTIPPASCPVPSTIPCVLQNLTSSQVFLSYSDDQGANWSLPIAIDGPVPASGVKRWWPTVSVEPSGVVDVVYYESLEAGLTSNPSDIECNRALQGNVRRAGTAISLLHTYWVRSVDEGASFKPRVRVTDVGSNWCAVGSNIIPNMGDYIFGVSGGNRVFPTWADGRNGFPDTFFAEGLGTGKKK